MEEFDCQERIPTMPPIIKPLAAYNVRPLWSVMIPVYNCIEYLQQTLESVLIQGVEVENMQIVVVDDCGNDGDVEALVRSIAGQRATYFRQTENRGSLRNFETCLNLSIGHWVHILHGDDRIMPGFYNEIGKLFHQYPEAGAAFTGTCLITSDNTTVHTYNPLLNQSGIVKDFAVQNAKQLLLQPPAIVVKRAVYEQLGGFYAAHYGEDWEMWTRIAAYFPIAYSPLELACYRYYTNNGITQKHFLNGKNIIDIIKVIDIMQNHIPMSERDNVKKIARREYAIYCLNMAYILYNNNKKAAMLQVRGALELSGDIKVYKRLIKYFLISRVANTTVRKHVKNLLLYLRLR